MAARDQWPDSIIDSGREILAFDSFSFSLGEESKPKAGA